MLTQLVFSSPGQINLDNLIYEIIDIIRAL
jgi:hypothetical protein